jgi:thymidylate synthase
VVYQQTKKNNQARAAIFSPDGDIAGVDQMALPVTKPINFMYPGNFRVSSISTAVIWNLEFFAFNVFSAALLIRMIAQQCDLQPG